ncbi:expressed unknown protein [Ectocarpus siliculosus]|uniref:Secreted protein n=1 Tax=Ectocarpus siliculosus TaxID=2880 RepID=D8LNL7_ECTSI|nr:expressed unknown protein [Ectocarpus siliculosus]|eukprot:CBN78227.1 expressed unknown protein [Ectocarpus siliculosus]
MLITALSLAWFLSCLAGVSGNAVPLGRANERRHLLAPAAVNDVNLAHFFMGHGVVGGSEPVFVFLRKVDGVSISPFALTGRKRIGERRFFLSTCTRKAWFHKVHVFAYLPSRSSLS